MVKSISSIFLFVLALLICLHSITVFASSLDRREKEALDKIAQRTHHSKGMDHASKLHSDLSEGFRSEWPDLVGISGEHAKAAILKEKNNNIRVDIVPQVLP